MNLLSWRRELIIIHELCQILCPSRLLYCSNCCWRPSSWISVCLQSRSLPWAPTLSMRCQWPDAADIGWTVQREHWPVEKTQFWELTCNTIELGQRHAALIAVWICNNLWTFVAAFVSFAVFAKSLALGLVEPVLVNHSSDFLTSVTVCLLYLMQDPLLLILIFSKVV